MKTKNEVLRKELKRKAKRANKRRVVRAATFGKKKNRKPTLLQMFGNPKTSFPENGIHYAEAKCTRKKKKNRLRLSIKAKHKLRLKRKQAR